MKMDFGERLKELRKAAHFTQESVAKVLKVNRTTYLAYESNKFIPNAYTCRALANLYGISLEALLGSERSHPTLRDSASKFSAEPLEDTSIDFEKIQNLSPEERHLICLFRGATQQQKEEILKEASSFFEEEP